MPSVTEKFGKYICDITPENPDRSRKLLLAAYRAYGVKLKLFPDKKLPRARQFAARYVNNVVSRMLAHPKEAALVSVFMPCELINALDIIPMCAELYSCFINGAQSEAVFAQRAQEEGIAETFCSYHKILLGTAYSGVLKPPSMVVNTSLVCDANNLTFRELADYYDIPQYYIDVPADRSRDAVSYVADQFRGLKIFLEDNTGKSLSKERLKENIARSNDTIKYFKKCFNEKKSHYVTNDVTSELYEIYMTHNALGTKEAYRYAKELYANLKAAGSKKGIRLLWLHTMPNWQEPVRKLLDANDRCQIVSCDMNFESLFDMDPEKPYESMAHRLVYSRWNGGDVRIEFAVKAAKALDIDGVVCFCHWGCKQTMGLSAAFKSQLEDEGFPTLILNGDGVDRANASDGQVSTRLNAFLEMLEGGSRE